MSFTPQHAQPVSVASLTELEPDTLTAEISRLQNSIAHLKRSNTELREFCSPPTGSEAEGEDLDEETKREFELSVQENEETIARQEERLVMIRLAMERKLGVDATNSHYDIIGLSSGANPLANQGVNGGGPVGGVERETETDAVEAGEVDAGALDYSGGIYL